MFFRLKQWVKRILLLIGKRLRIDLLYVARSGFWLTSSQFLSTLLTFILSVAYANLMPKEVYGSYRYVLSIVGILSITALPGINDALLRAVARGQEGSLALAVKKKISWGLLGGLACLAVALYYFYGNQSSIASAFLVAAVFVPFTDAFATYDAFLQGKKLFRASAVFFVIFQCAFAGLLSLVLFLTHELVLVLAAYFIITIGTRLALYLTAVRLYRPNEKIDFSITPYGKHLSAMGIVGSISSYLDRLLLFHYVGPLGVAAYTVAVGPPEQIKGYIKNIYSIAVPKFSRQTETEIRSTIRHKALLLLIALVGIVALYIILAPTLFHLLFRNYSDAIIYTQLYAISLLSGVNILYYSALQSQAAIKKLYYFSFAGPILLIILELTLIPTFGILGAIIAKTAARFLTTAVSFWLVEKK